MSGLTEKGGVCILASDNPEIYVFSKFTSADQSMTLSEQIRQAHEQIISKWPQIADDKKKQ